ncbi:lipid-A-disaccharide synthase [Reinekea marinisedimentorum]|uniref:Lipid-A-disaccharide synthase n=1 Tax=Reinekea marinisedimentorum TaxID=230495 RepID=A0A4R3I6L7_9GAMM|nr:lipid-A-disaccharide synthase [Reinekea marinisedimentorum]TCS40720.1 lipid-A-disaccharide synthase [Reinekea marinisedimentorum]
MARKLRVAVLAGEASGDILGAGLMKTLKAKYPDIEFGGIGGPLMIAEGLTSRVPMERLSVMGITEVLGRLRELFAIRDQYRDWCIGFQPDVFVGIDAPDFNLGLEQQLRKAGIKTVHYVSPSVWAWRKGRIRKIRKAVDHMLTLLPFEAAFYEQENIPVTFVGHTLADQLPLQPNTAQARNKLAISGERPVVAMLPGSRGSEVKLLTRLFLDALTVVSERIGPIDIVIPAANLKRRAQIEAILADHPISASVTLLDKQADDAITASDATLVASGTATLQTLLLKKPMVVAYKMSPLSYFIISRLATTRWASLPNILEQRDWVPERLQQAATVEQISEDMITALSDDAYRQSFVALATDWHKKLALNADEQAASAVLNLALK